MLNVQFRMNEKRMRHQVFQVELILFIVTSKVKHLGSLTHVPTWKEVVYLTNDLLPSLSQILPARNPPANGVRMIKECYNNFAFN